MAGPGQQHPAQQAQQGTLAAAACALEKDALAAPHQKLRNRQAKAVPARPLVNEILNLDYEWVHRGFMDGLMPSWFHRHRTRVDWGVSRRLDCFRGPAMATSSRRRPENARNNSTSNSCSACGAEQWKTQAASSSP